MKPDKNNESSRFQFRMDPIRDRVLIEWLNQLGSGERSVFVREVLRRELGRQKNNIIGDYPGQTIDKANIKSVQEDLQNEICSEEAEEKLNKLSDVF